MAEAHYGWDDLKSGIRRLHEQHPDFLSRAILVGGAACMFYRAVLARAAHPAYPVPQGCADTADAWLSKDVDFACLDTVDFPADPPLPLGRLQSGIRLSALDFAETVRTASLEFADGDLVPILWNSTAKKRPVLSSCHGPKTGRTWICSASIWPTNGPWCGNTASRQSGWRWKPVTGIMPRK